MLRVFDTRGARASLLSEKSIVQPLIRASKEKAYRRKLMQGHHLRRKNYHYGADDIDECSSEAKILNKASSTSIQGPSLNR